MTAEPRDELADLWAPRPVTASEVVLHGRIWDVRRESVDLGGDEPVVRDFVDHPGAVAVLALDDQDRVLMVRQYRHPVRMELWELPAGLLDVEGEDRETAAARELEEESGLVATSTTPLAWTDDVFVEESLHYITLHFAVVATGDPVVREPEKLREWRWFAPEALPDPLFGPVAALLATGWTPTRSTPGT